MNHRVSEIPKKRIPFWDISKAVAIFCVVWGHCLQNLTSDDSYWHTDIVSRIIVSFNMPLFMIISGYFAYCSLSRSVCDVLVKRFRQLIIPSVAWAIIVGLLVAILHRDLSYERFGGILSGLTHSYWFLKSLFGCYAITLIGYRLYRFRFWAFGLYIIVVLASGELLNYAQIISMLPFFCTGLLLHHKKQLFVDKKEVIATGSILIFITLFMLFDTKVYNVYMNPFSLDELTLLCVGGGKSFLIRTLIGITGSLPILFVLYVFTSVTSTRATRFLSELGTMTLGFYCIQVIIAEGLYKSFPAMISRVNPLTGTAAEAIFYDFIATPAAAVLCMAACYGIIQLLKTTKITRLIFLGETK